MSRKITALKFHFGVDNVVIQTITSTPRGTRYLLDSLRFDHKPGDKAARRQGIEEQLTKLLPQSD